MTHFEFTKEFVVSSSLIDAVYFNENDNTAVLDVDDELYRYSGVNGADVSTLVRGGEDGSVGAHYNKVFKKSFGPGEHLGYYDDVEPVEVSVKKDQSVPTTPKGLSDGPHLTVVPDAVNINVPVATKEYSLNSEPKVSTGVGSAMARPVSDEPTPEFSLSFEDEAPEASEAEGIEGVSEIVVHFTLVGFDRKFKFVAENSDTVEGAIEELNDYVSKMKAAGRVRKVVVKF